MGRRKNREKFEAHVSAADAKVIRALANKAGVSASHLVTRLVEVAARRSRNGRVGVSGSLVAFPGFITMAAEWQKEIPDGESPTGCYVEVDLLATSSRFCKSRESKKVGAPSE